MIDIRATIESDARDCDGMHYRETEYHMEEKEMTGEFGDLDFFQRILSYVVSTSAESATLRITQDENRLPIFQYDENTEEGFRSERVTFTKH